MFLYLFFGGDNFSYALLQKECRAKDMQKIDTDWTEKSGIIKAFKYILL